MIDPHIRPCGFDVLGRQSHNPAPQRLHFACDFTGPGWSRRRDVGSSPSACTRLCSSCSCSGVFLAWLPYSQSVVFAKLVVFFFGRVVFGSLQITSPCHAVFSSFQIHCICTRIQSVAKVWSCSCCLQLSSGVQQLANQTHFGCCSARPCDRCTVLVVSPLIRSCLQLKRCHRLLVGDSSAVEAPDRLNGRSARLVGCCSASPAGVHLHSHGARVGASLAICSFSVSTYCRACFGKLPRCEKCFG